MSLEQSSESLRARLKNGLRKRLPYRLVVEPKTGWQQVIADWQWLLYPEDTPSTYNEPQRKKTFQSLITVLVPITILFCVLWFAQVLVSQQVSPLIYLLTLVLAITYRLAWTDYAELGLRLSILVLALVGMVGLFVDAGSLLPFAFLLMSLFTASLFLSSRTVWMLVGVCLAGIAFVLLARQGQIDGLSLVVLVSALFVIRSIFQEQERSQAQRRTFQLIAQEQAQLRKSIKTESTKTLSTMIQDASHELKTPISIISNNAYIVQKQVQDKDALEAAAVIASQAEAMRDMINDLFALSRLDSGPTMRISDVDMMPAIRDLEEKIRPMAEGRHVILRFDLAENIPTLRLDEEEFKRAILNLLTNAVRYTPGGGMVTLRTYRRRAYAAIEVIDTGIGISEEDLSRIFDRFYRVTRTNSATDKGGSGLGLAITQNIIEALGGEIKVESKEGEGSTFRITLPLPDATVTKPS